MLPTTVLPAPVVDMRLNLHFSKEIGRIHTEIAARGVGDFVRIGQTGGVSDCVATSCDGGTARCLDAEKRRKWGGVVAIGRKRQAWDCASGRWGR